MNKRNLFLYFFLQTIINSDIINFNTTNLTFSNPTLIEENLFIIAGLATVNSLQNNTDINLNGTISFLNNSLINNQSLQIGNTEEQSHIFIEGLPNATNSGALLCMDNLTNQIYYQQNNRSIPTDQINYNIVETDTVLNNSTNSIQIQNINSNNNPITLSLNTNNNFNFNTDTLYLNSSIIDSYTNQIKIISNTSFGLLNGTAINCLKNFTVNTTNIFGNTKIYTANCTINNLQASTISPIDLFIGAKSLTINNITFGGSIAWENMAEETNTINTYLTLNSTNQLGINTKGPQISFTSLNTNKMDVNSLLITGSIGNKNNTSVILNVTSLIQLSDQQKQLVFFSPAIIDANVNIQSYKGMYRITNNFDTLQINNIDSNFVSKIQTIYRTNFRGPVYFTNLQPLSTFTEYIVISNTILPLGVNLGSIKKQNFNNLESIEKKSMDFLVKEKKHETIKNIFNIPSHCLYLLKKIYDEISFQQKQIKKQDDAIDKLEKKYIALIEEQEEKKHDFIIIIEKIKNKISLIENSEKRNYYINLLNNIIAQ